jgi:hypothetical protein
VHAIMHEVKGNSQLHILATSPSQTQVTTKLVWIWWLFDICPSRGPNPGHLAHSIDFMYSTIPHKINLLSYILPEDCTFSAVTAPVNGSRVRDLIFQELIQSCSQFLK